MQQQIPILIGRPRTAILTFQICRIRSASSFLGSHTIVHNFGIRLVAAIGVFALPAVTRELIGYPGVTAFEVLMLGPGFRC